METPTAPCCSTPNCCCDKKKCLLCGVVAVVVLFFVAALAFSAGKQLGPKQVPLCSPCPTCERCEQSLNQPSPIDPTAGWETFRIKTINLEFKLPSEIAKQSWEETIIKGEKGTGICFRVIKDYGSDTSCDLGFYPLVMGGTSIDFAVSRGSNYSDYQGYAKINGKYFAKFLYGQRMEMPSDLVKEFNNNNGVEIIKVSGRGSEQPDPPSNGVPHDEESLGALINTKNSTYPGISVLLRLNEGISEKIFDQILSTFRFLD